MISPTLSLIQFTPLFLLLILQSCTPSEKKVEANNESAINIPCIQSDLVDEFLDCVYAKNPDTIEVTISLRPGEEFPDLRRFKKLEEVFVACIEKGCLESVGPNLFMLTGLKRLYLSKSSLRTLPDEINRLENLEVLSISGGGRLLSLPKNMNNLNQLRILSLWRNSLDTLPENLGELPMLENLIIGENKNLKLEKEQLRFPKIEVIDYKPNW